MRTITFYSYKGGVGRSLLVANAAKYLSTLGKSVFAIDLDLEAPGLHYKFELGQEAVRSSAAAGVVDLLTDFQSSLTIPNSLDDFTTQVKVAEGAGTIRIMRAGTAPQNDYWRQLSQINWHDLLYGEEPSGVPFFLELKERISQLYKPDFFLVDARTGITEMGGIATTLLADTVVCLTLASAEHLEGMRAVMRGISRTTTQNERRVDLVGVLSRLPAVKEDAQEEKAVADVLAFLNSAEDNEKGLHLKEIIPLHSEPLLDMGEQLLVGSKNTPHDLPLLRDYLKLFAKIIPAEDIRPYVGKLIERATSRLLDDPDLAQSELEALTTYCADKDAYRALLRLYSLRKAPIEKTLAVAALMWQLGAEAEPILVDIVAGAFSEFRASDAQKKYAEFAEGVWRASGMKDAKVGLTISGIYSLHRRQRAAQLLLDYVNKVENPDPTAISRLIDLLRGAASLELGFSIVNRFKNSDRPSGFYGAWARFVLDQKNPSLVDILLEDDLFKVTAAQEDDPVTLYKLLKLVEHPATQGVLKEATDDAIANERRSRLREVAEIFSEEGRIGEFQALVKGKLPSSMVEEILEMVRRRRPGALYR